MSDRVILKNGVEITVAQAKTLSRLSKEHPGSTWHMNDCGCCACFHPGGKTDRGWIIGRDGDYDYVGPGE